MPMVSTGVWRHVFASLVLVLSSALATAQVDLPPAEVRAIAEEAMIYGFPLVMNYGVMYESFIDRKSPQYKSPFNTLSNMARVFTPADTAVVTPNSDTPYSFFAADLRAEPVVVSVPAIEKQRYYSVQLVDWYTFNFGYLGSRTTGNEAGDYLIVGPGWQGETPQGIAKVFQCETEFVFAIFRTQLFDPADLENVKKIQAGYQLRTLSQYLQQSPPAAPAPLEWPAIDKELVTHNPFVFLNFLLQFCPSTGPASVEKPLRERFAKIGIVAGQPFSPDRFSAEQKTELVAGIRSGLAKIKQRVEQLGRDENGWRVGAAFGDRAFYQGDWTMRAAAAMAGIYGNDLAEAMYPMLKVDATGKAPDCTQNRYTLTFPANGLPPAHAFWSVTMYDAKTQLLVANPLNRYLINSPMLPGLQDNADGSLTIYIQKDSPGKEREANWLPAPAGPIYVVMRVYWPQKAALNGSWKPPALQPVR